MLPYFLNPFIMPNAGIFLSYFNVGIAIYILQAPLSYYLIDTLDISSTSYNAFFTLVALPWSLKFLLGSVTDGVPIFGYRRKSWLLIGWVFYILSALGLAFVSEPSFLATAFISFIMTCSYILADVCNDALCVERARHEQEEIKGAIQTAGYTIRFAYSIGIALFSLYLYMHVRCMYVRVCMYARVHYVCMYVCIHGFNICVWMNSFARTCK